MSEKSDNIKKNIEDNRRAIEASRIQKTGLTNQKVKLSSKNFDKLMKERGLSNQSIDELKKSNVQSEKMQVRHAKVGEQFVTTHGIQRSSGIFVSEKSLGKTPEERIDKGALPHSNSAEYETRVELTCNQNLVYGKIAPQSKFSKMDPKQQVRNGGGEQIITNGGYNSGAVRTKDAKYPVPVKQSIMQRVSEHKSQNGIKMSNSNKTNAASHSHSKSGGQSI